MTAGRSNADIVRDLIDAVNRGDVESCVRLTHPDVDFVPLRAATEGRLRGHDGVRRWFAWNDETFTSFVFDTHDLIDLDEHSVLHVATIRARGRESEAVAHQSSVNLFEVRNGLVTRSYGYTTRDAALHAYRSSWTAASSA